MHTSTSRESYPEQLRAIASKFHGEITPPKHGADPYDFEGILGGPATELAYMPNRFFILKILAEIATWRADTVVPFDPEQMLSAPRKLEAISDKAQGLLDHICSRHGHISTVSLRLVEVAKRSSRFETRFLKEAHKHDPEFYELYRSHGRGQQPSHLYPIFVIYEAEKLLDGPILDITPFRGLLVP